MSQEFPAIPDIRVQDRQVNDLIRAIKMNLDTLVGRIGDGQSRALRVSDLVDQGILTLNSNGGIEIGPEFEEGEESNPTTPPTPTNLTANGAFGVIILSWDDPGYSDLAYTEVWRSSSNDLGVATRIGTSRTTLYTDDVGTGSEYYYWIRHVSIADVEGAYNAGASSGTYGATAHSFDYVMDALIIPWKASTAYVLDDYIRPTPFNVGSYWFKCTTAGTTGGTEPDWSTITGVGQTKSDGTVVWTSVATQAVEAPFLIGEVGGTPKVVISDTHIRDAAITNAKIANLAVDTAKIANLAVDTAQIANAAVTNAKINDLAANKITVGDLGAAITTGAGGLIRSKSSGYRVEIDNGTYPLWYGTGTKNATNALFYVDNAGNLLARGSMKTDTTGQRIEILSSDNELHFYGDRGDTTIEELCTIGITPSGGDDIIGLFGSSNSTKIAIDARSSNSPALQVTNDAATYYAGAFTNGGGAALYAQSDGTKSAVTATQINGTDIESVQLCSAWGQIYISPHDTITGYPSARSAAIGAFMVEKNGRLYYATATGTGGWGLVPTSKSPQTYSTNALGALSFWYPTHGWYMMIGEGEYHRLDLYGSSAWQNGGELGLSGMYWADGSDMRIYNSDSSSRTIKYLKMDA